MIHIDFEISLSKVKATVTVNMLIYRPNFVKGQHVDKLTKPCPDGN